MKRIFVILLSVAPLAAPAKAQMTACRDFTIGPTLQIDACNNAIGIYGIGGVGGYAQRMNAFLLRGAAFARKGDTVNATADYQYAIRLADDSAERANQALWHNQRCWTRAVAGLDLDIAVAQCKEALRLRPDSREALDSLGFVSLRLRRYLDAKADYDAALAQNPRSSSSLLGRAVAKLHLGDEEGARADAAAAKALDVGILEEFAAYGVQ